MELEFTREQEAKLVPPRFQDEDARFRAAVLEGKDSAERGEFIEEGEMDARFEEMLRG